MKKRCSAILCLAATALLSCTIEGTGDELSVRLTGDYLYRCDTGAEIKARYFSLSDDSLHFAKVVLPDNSEVTLPSVVSGSGARYSNHSLEWWVKGNEGMLSVFDGDQQAQILYDSCRSAKE